LSQTIIGRTINPCGTTGSVEPEQHPNNGYASNGAVVAQLAEGRVGTVGQAVNLELNGLSAPFIWSVLQFDSSGNIYFPIDNAIFPTYDIYLNGIRTMRCPQSNPSAMISNNSSYQRLPSDIPDTKVANTCFPYNQ
jgi:hypothetical protein